MKRITENTKKKAVQIAFSSFLENASIAYFLKNDSLLSSRMLWFCEYLIELSMLKDGAYISDDEEGVALIYVGQKKIPFLKQFSLNLQLINKCIGWGRIIKVLKRQSLVLKKRHQESHLYFLLLASSGKNGNSTVIDLKDGAFELSEKLGLPILAEASSRKAQITYERYGFKKYNTLNIPKTDIVLAFLRRGVDGQKNH